MSRRKRAFEHRYGPWALVAGAAEGIGAALARELAGRRLDLVLVDRKAAPLEALAGELDATGVRTRCVVGDLGDLHFLRSLDEETRSLEVGLVVYNAAIGLVGPFLGHDEDGLCELLDVNCRGPLLLARRHGERMAARGRGGIVIISSVAGMQGTPLVAAYSATKAFDTALAEALWAELGRHGVDVVALCAGATRTPGYLSSNPKPKPFPPLMEPGEVARSAISALDERRGPTVVAGKANRAVGLLMGRILPRRYGVGIMDRAMRDLYE